MRAPNTTTRAMELISFRNKRKPFADVLLAAYIKERGHMRRVAKNLGVGHSTLYQWMGTMWEPPMTTDELWLAWGVPR